MKAELNPGFYRVRSVDGSYVQRKIVGNHVELTSTREKTERASLPEALKLASEWAQWGNSVTLEATNQMTIISCDEIQCHCGAVWKKGRFQLTEEDCPHCDPVGWRLAVSPSDCTPIRVEKREKIILK